MPKKYFSIIVNYAAAGILAAGLMIFPENFALTKSARVPRESSLIAEVNPYKSLPGNVWGEAVGKKGIHKISKPQVPLPKLFYSNPKKWLKNEFNKRGANETMRFLASIPSEKTGQFYSDIGGLRGIAEIVGCGRYSRDVSDLRGLEKIINQEAMTTEVNALEILTFIRIESGGLNTIGCGITGKPKHSSDSGVMQLNVNFFEEPHKLLNTRENIREGIKKLKGLYEEFGDKKLAILAWNIGDGRVIKYREQIREYFSRKGIKQEVEYKHVLWLMKKYEPKIGERGENYVRVWGEIMKKTKKEGIIQYNEKANKLYYTIPKRKIAPKKQRNAGLAQFYLDNNSRNIGAV